MVCPPDSPRSRSRSRSRRALMSLLPFSCLLELTTLLRLSTLVCAADVYVDDNDGTLSYSGSWQEGNGCSTCALHPDASQVYGGTWHDTTFYSSGDAMSVTLKFTGVGISAYFVVPDKSQGDATVDTNLVFTLDGSQAGTYTHSPSGDADFLYNQALFEKSGLSNDDHTLVVSAAASDGQSSAVLFDYLVYETGDETSNSASTAPTSSTSSLPLSSSTSSSSSTASGGSSSSSDFSSSASGTSTGSSSSSTTESSLGSFSSGTSGVSPTDVSATGNTTSTSGSSDSSPSHRNVGTIVGGVVGGVLGLLLALLLLLCCRRRMKRARDDADADSSVPTTVTATLVGAPGRRRSWFWLKPREDTTFAPYPVTFSDAGSSPPTDKIPPYSSNTATTYKEKGRPVINIHPDPTSPVLQIGPDRPRWPRGTTEDAHSSTQAVASTVNTADILSQVAAIHAAVLSLRDQRVNGPAVDVDALVPPPVYSAGDAARSETRPRPDEGRRPDPEQQ